MTTAISVFNAPGMKNKAKNVPTNKTRNQKTMLDDDVVIHILHISVGVSVGVGVSVSVSWVFSDDARRYSEIAQLNPAKYSL